jgi:hypothetical protein
MDVNMKCDREGFDDDACDADIYDGFTPTDQIMDTFNRCTFEATQEYKEFSRPPTAGNRRELRLDSQRALRGQICNHQCIDCDICCGLMGFCGTTGCCTCGCERRLTAEEEILDILKATRRLPNGNQIAAQCTQEIKLLAQELDAIGNRCLGEWNKIKCYATVFGE